MKNITERQFILSSSSPARRALLERMKAPFIATSPNVDETPLPNEMPQALVKRLAYLKAQASAKTYSDALIIGCDQVGFVDQQILGKPHTHERAVQQLSFLSGKTIEFYIGLCLLDSATGQSWETLETYTATMRPLSEPEILAYLQQEQPYHCAGSCQIEGLGISLVEKLLGDDYTALIGLPLIKLTSLLREAGYKWL